MESWNSRHSTVSCMRLYISSLSRLIFSASGKLNLVYKVVRQEGCVGAGSITSLNPDAQRAWQKRLSIGDIFQGSVNAIEAISPMSANAPQRGMTRFVSSRYNLNLSLAPACPDSSSSSTIRRWDVERAPEGEHSARIIHVVGISETIMVSKTHHLSFYRVVNNNTSVTN